MAVRQREELRYESGGAYRELREGLAHLAVQSVRPGQPSHVEARELRGNFRRPPPRVRILLAESLAASFERDRGYAPVGKLRREGDGRGLQRAREGRAYNHVDMEGARLLLQSVRLRIAWGASCLGLGSGGP